MRKKIEEPQAPEVALVEAMLTEIIPVETQREQKEAEVEEARAAKLAEVAPELMPLDEKEQSLKQSVVQTIKDNKDKKGFFPQGRRSISTRAGVAGIKKGPAYIRLSKDGMTEPEIIQWLWRHDRKGYNKVVEVTKRLHRTRFRQAVRDKYFDDKTLGKLGVTLNQKEHVYVRTKTAKRGKRPSSAKGTMRKAKVVKP
jgi:hypothetical protein